MEKQKLLVVAGPTASGKTGLGVALAKRLGGEVVSADSMQIYRGMDIATAKPDEAEMEGIPHHLIGFLDPGERYSVADFTRDAGRAIEEIAGRGRLPILVGGTGLYLSSLIDNVTFSEATGSDQIRAALYDIALREGPEKLHGMLARVDPDSARRLHPNNVGRVARAIEVFQTTGKPMSWHLLQSRRRESPYLPAMIGLTCRDRERLYEKIDARVDRMMENGLLEEARAIFENGTGPTAFQAIGYKELAPYFLGERSLLECVGAIKQGTRRYAKRQLTWFRRDGRINWIETDCLSPGEVVSQAIGLINSVFGGVLGE